MVQIVPISPLVVQMLILLLKKNKPAQAGLFFYRLLINPMIFLIKIMGFNIGFKNNALALSYEYALT
jgi:hypothetical protein